MHIEVYEKKPEGFLAKTEVAACYIEIDGKILFLQRAERCSEPGTWSLPAGKLEQGESPKEAAIRELFEETGIALDVGADIQYTGSSYVQKTGGDFVFHIFTVRLDKMPAVHLSEEHQNYIWASSKDLETLPLISGAKETVPMLPKTPTVKKRTGNTHVNAFLILRQGDKVLFHLRKNTGYNDEMWGVISGHVEDGEPATVGMIREAKEEIGITISQASLKVVHVVHHKSNRLNLNIFFECTKWEGSITNMEPDKCEKLEFFSLDALPANTIDANRVVLEYIREGKFYSELGW